MPEGLPSGLMVLLMTRPNLLSIKKQALYKKASVHKQHFR
jgi:hypothetical protein